MSREILNERAEVIVSMLLVLRHSAYESLSSFSKTIYVGTKIYDFFRQLTV